MWACTFRSQSSLSLIVCRCFCIIKMKLFLPRLKYFVLYTMCSKVKKVLDNFISFVPIFFYLFLIFEIRKTTIFDLVFWFLDKSDNFYLWYAGHLGLSQIMVGWDVLSNDMSLAGENSPFLRNYLEKLF